MCVKNSVAEKLKNQVKNAIKIMVDTTNYTSSQYIPFKHTISIEHTESYQMKRGPNSIRIDSVKFVFNTEKLSMRECFSFLKWANLDEFTFSEQIKFEVKGKLKEQSPFIPILSVNLEKKPLDPSKDFLSLEDVDSTYQLLGHQNYFKILKKYMFPEGFQSQAEITLDIAKPSTFPQKRRTVSIDITKMKFHQIITKITPLVEFQKIIKQNKIAGIYCSVKSTNDNLIYFLIDIDVPSQFYSLFPKQKVWELTINIIKAITEAASRFRLSQFKVSFSGAKGVHMLWALAKSDVITDAERYVNLPELYNLGNLPGIATLKREKISSIGDKFKFAKSLLQSLLLFTIYKGNIEIPDTIKQGLKISYPHQLFRLSPDSKNRLAILLDTSSMSRGVFRLFSPHPTTKLVSIPLFSGIIDERYLDYDNVREDAKLEKVIERLNNDDVDLFLLTPSKITRPDIRELFRPDRLFPAFATLLRFGTIYSTMRSLPSFNFWYRFFELKSFYSYVERIVFTYKNDSDDSATLIAFIDNMAAKLHIENKDQIIHLINLHLKIKKISFPLFKHKLTTLYFTEFFFTIKSNVFLQNHQEKLLELFDNESEFGYFLNQVQEIFNIAADTISRHVILEGKTTTNLSKTQMKSVNKFFNDTLSLIEIARSYLENLKYDSGAANREGLLIKTIFFVGRLYAASIAFLSDFYNLLEQSKGIHK